MQKLLKTNLNLGIYIHNNLGPWHLDTSTLVPYEYVAGYFAFVLTQKAMLPSWAVNCLPCRNESLLLWGSNKNSKVFFLFLIWHITIILIPLKFHINSFVVGSSSYIFLSKEKETSHVYPDIFQTELTCASGPRNSKRKKKLGGSSESKSNGFVSTVD